MTSLRVLLFVGLLVAPSVVPAPFKLPSYVKTRCFSDDPNLNKCALEQARRILPFIASGDPSIKLMPIDPLKIDKIEMAPGGNTKSVGLLLKCHKCQITGLKDAVINDIVVNIKEGIFRMKADIPVFKLVGEIEANGKVLILPVVGRGPGSITGEGVTIDVKFDTEIVKRGKNEYLNFKSFKIDFNMKLMSMDMREIFNGNKQLGDNLNTFLNENWREVVKDLQPAISETIGQIAMNVVKSVFNSIPYKELFPSSI